MLQTGFTQQKLYVVQVMLTACLQDQEGTWTGFLSIIWCLVLYTQQQVYVIQVMLTVC